MISWYLYMDVTGMLVRYTASLNSKSSDNVALPQMPQTDSAITILTTLMTSLTATSTIEESQHVSRLHQIILLLLSDAILMAPDIASSGIVFKALTKTLESFIYFVEQSLEANYSPDEKHMIVYVSSLQRLVSLGKKWMKVYAADIASTSDGQSKEYIISWLQCMLTSAGTLWTVLEEGIKGGSKKGYEEMVSCVTALTPELVASYRTLSATTAPTSSGNKSPKKNVSSSKVSSAEEWLTKFEAEYSDMHQKDAEE